MSLPDLGETGHTRAWVMTATRAKDLRVGFEGRCSCRWRGEWRALAINAEHDIDAHLAGAGVDPSTVARNQPEP